MDLFYASSVRIVPTTIFGVSYSNRYNIKQVWVAQFYVMRQAEYFLNVFKDVGNTFLLTYKYRRQAFVNKLSNNTNIEICKKLDTS